MGICHTAVLLVGGEIEQISFDTLSSDVQKEYIDWYTDGINNTAPSDVDEIDSETENEDWFLEECRDQLEDIDSIRQFFEDCYPDLRFIGNGYSGEYYCFGYEIDLSADSLDDEVLSLKDKFNNIFPELSTSIYLETAVW